MDSEKSAEGMSPVGTAALCPARNDPLPKCLPFDPRILSYTPHTGIDLGGALRKADDPKEQVHLRENAQLAVRRFHRFAATFADGSREAVYLDAVFMAAIQLASGLLRIQSEKERKEKKLENDYLVKERHIAEGEGVKAFLGAGTRFIWLGGFVVSLVLFLVPFLRRGESDGVKLVDPNYAALATACGTALFSAWWNKRNVLKALHNLREDDTKACRQLEEEVRKAQDKEYGDAEARMNHAWMILTGQRPPTMDELPVLPQ